MKILSIDIETSPNLAYVWQLYGHGLDRGISNDKLVETSEMISFAAKWVEERTQDTEPVFYSNFSHGHRGMLEAVFDLLDEADVLLHFNGVTFDEPKINRELVSYGFWPPSPYRRIDLYRVVRAKFAFPSGKLDFVCQELGIGSKTEHDGFELWKRCLADDADAWAKMEEYNKNDAVLNEDLYRVLLPWIPGIPSFGAEAGEDLCPACGSTDLGREGFAYTKSGRYQRFICHQCHMWSRSSRRDAGTQIVQCLT